MLKPPSKMCLAPPPRSLLLLSIICASVLSRIPEQEKEEKTSPPTIPLIHIPSPSDARLIRFSFRHHLNSIAYDAQNIFQSTPGHREKPTHRSGLIRLATWSIIRLPQKHPGGYEEQSQSAPRWTMNATCRV